MILSDHMILSVDLRSTTHKQQMTRHDAPHLYVLVAHLLVLVTVGPANG